MINISGILDWLIKNPAITGIIGAWLIYRISKNQERNEILNSLESEIDIHKNWMAGDYPDGFTQPSFKEKGYVVFKLSTVAIDNAISRGAGLFINKNLIGEVILYRQLVEAFNQLVDSQQMFQANSELWVKSPDKAVEKRMERLTEQIHTYGIGSSSRKQSAHNIFRSLNKELKEEKVIKLSWFVWLITGINIFFLKKYF